MWKKKSNKLKRFQQNQQKPSFFTNAEADKKISNIFFTVLIWRHSLYENTSLFKLKAGESE